MIIYLDQFEQLRYCSSISCIENIAFVPRRHHVLHSKEFSVQGSHTILSVLGRIKANQIHTKVARPVTP